MIEVSVRPPKTSSNPRVEAVYAVGSVLPNREFTLPVVGRALYRDPVVKENPAIQSLIEENLRVITTPPAVSRLDAERKSRLKTLASPLECGRVLELDESVLLDGIGHTVTIKGVGATRFFRETGGEGPFVNGKRFTDSDRTLLDRFPFLGWYGVFTARAAIAEVLESKRLRARGIDAEKILAVYALDQIPDRDGTLKPITYYIDNKQIHDGSRPVLMFRAMKTNFRLLDPHMLIHSGEENSVPTLLKQTIEQYARLEGVENPTLQGYFHWVAGKIIVQEMPLILEGIDMTSSGRWSDLARNVSMMGEELDLESVSKNRISREAPEYFEYGMHFRTNFDNAVTALDNLAESINAYGGEYGQIDPVEYAEFFWKTIVEAIQSIDFENLYKAFHPKMLYNHGISDSESFTSWVYFQILNVFRSGNYKGTRIDLVKFYDIVGSKLRARKHEMEEAGRGV